MGFEWTPLRGCLVMPFIYVCIQDRSRYPSVVAADGWAYVLTRTGGRFRLEIVAVDLQPHFRPRYERLWDHEWVMGTGGFSLDR